jgi:choloylglycine hydrolase
MVKDFHENDSKQPIIDFSFDVLKNVSQEGWTRWSIVYDITNKSIYFKTVRFPTVKSIAFADFDFSCHSQPLAFNMNQLLSGKVSKEFKPLTKEINKLLMDRSAEESKTQVTISEADRVMQVEYAEKIACK